MEINMRVELQKVLNLVHSYTKELHIFIVADLYT